MRPIYTLIFACCACILTSVIATENDLNLWKKQKLVLDVLQHFHQNNIFSEEHSKLAADFKWDNYADKFGVDSKLLIDEVKLFWDQGLLTLKTFDKDHMPSMRALYRLFYFAEDFETFEALSWWARIYVNPGLFDYCFSVAIVHRPDMYNIVLPAPYEIYPFMFFGADVIENARKYQLSELKEDKYEFVVKANYTSSYFNETNESKIAYYREDVDLNTFNYYLLMSCPPWMNLTQFNHAQPRRGEIFLFQTHNILARYTLERFSNGLGKIPEFSFSEPIVNGYNSTFRFYNGDFLFPVRHNFHNVSTAENFNDLELLTLISQRFTDAVTMGYVELADGTRIDLTKPDSLNVLGNLIQGNPDSVNPSYYRRIEKVARKLLRGDNSPGVGSSVLEWPKTAMRDPMFYQFYKSILKYYSLLKNLLPKYTNEELFYDNVNFKHVNVSKLTTFFQEFESDMTNAVDIEAVAVTDTIESAPLFNFGRRSLYKNHDLHVKVQQMRLTRKHFVFTFKLNANNPAKVLIKTFLGPKVNEHGEEYTLNQMRDLFFLFDEQVVELNAGINTFKRLCHHIPGYSIGHTSYFELYKKMMNKQSLTWPIDNGYRGFPWRLMLPKGWTSGMPVKFFFYVMSYEADNMEKFDYNGFQFAVYKNQSLGFPLDRPFDANQWKLNPGNMYEYDTMIYHK